MQKLDVIKLGIYLLHTYYWLNRQNGGLARKAIGKAIKVANYDLLQPFKCTSISI